MTAATAVTTWRAVSTWSVRRWWVALGGAIAVALAIGLPTDVIPNPVFGRPLVGVQWWNYPVLVATAVLGGLLLATYVAEPGESAEDDLDPPGRVGGVGGLVSFLAVGCPTCNKVVVLAIGTSGALDWFAPAQPILGVTSLALLAWALRVRLRGQLACRIPAESPANANMST